MDDHRLSGGTYLGAPLYTEVRRRILSALQRGEWPHGKRLPTETQLAQRYGVSVGTIRKAVDALVSERLLIRQAGRGTYVATHTAESEFARYLQFFDQAGERVLPRAELLAFEQRAASPDVASHLDLAPGTRVLRIRNLRLWQDKPCMVDDIFVPPSLMSGLTRETFVRRTGSIYGLYQEFGGVTVLRVEESLGAGNASPSVTRHLGVGSATPLLLVQRMAFSFGNAAVEFRYRWVNPQIVLYRNVIGLRTA